MRPFEFQSVLFNFHDVVLIMTVMQCLFFSALLYVTNTSKAKSTLFLVAFLFAHALIPAHELILWGAEFKHLVRHQWPWLNFVPGIAYYLDGLFLFFCIRYLIFRDFSLRKIDLLHLIPAATYILFIATAFYSHSYEDRQHMLLTQSFVYSHEYIGMDFFSKLLRVIYAVACFVLIKRYKDLLKDRKANIEKSHIHWLSSLVVGFLVVMISDLTLVSVKLISTVHHIDGKVFEFIGLTGNHASFILVNLLFFLAIRNFITFEQVKDETPADKVADDHFVNPEMAEKIDEAMTQTRVYMDPEITLDKLAEELNTPARDLSMLINRHFGVNFYEFINKYRIEEAKKMLLDPAQAKTTITEIYLAVGFNSKSVFYTFFKKFEGMTPSKFKTSGNKKHD